MLQLTRINTFIKLSSLSFHKLDRNQTEENVNRATTLQAKAWMFTPITQNMDVYKAVSPMWKGF